MVPAPNELGWRSLFGAWFVDDNIHLRHNLTVELGLRQEFTTGWNEESGRAANYITDANGVLHDQPDGRQFGFHEEQRHELFSARASGLAWDVFGDGKTRCAPASAPIIR